MYYRHLALITLHLLPFATACAQPGKPGQAGKHDWPQWRGPDRTHVSTETGLLKEWPKSGPTVAWKAKGLGDGYSTPSIAQGRVFLMGNISREECLVALSETDGHKIWSTPIGKAGGAGGFEGPRSTPTVDGDRLYALGVGGNLVCANLNDGKIVWSKNLPKDFGGRAGHWGYCESILIDGDDLICTPGEGTTFAKLNKKDGSVVWKSTIPQGDHAHYSSPIVAEIFGVRQYINFLSGGVVSVAAQDGKFLWRYDRPHNGTANCSTPIFADGHVFAASSYGTGGGLAKLSANDGAFSADQVYFTKNMKNHHGGMVLVNGYIYGSNEGLMTCLDFKSGEVKWEERKTGKGAIAYADGRLYYRNEGSGDVFLVEATPEKFILHGQLKQPDRSSKNAWPHPVISNGRLYLRDQDVMFAYDIADKK